MFATQSSLSIVLKFMKTCIYFHVAFVQVILYIKALLLGNESVFPHELR